MTTMITVNAIYDEESGALTLDPPAITLGGGEQVEWKFQHVPAHCKPFIFFPDDQSQPRQPLGPFQYLESIVDGVIGIGNSGKRRNYPYLAMIIPESGPEISFPPRAQASGSIQNMSDLENTSPYALIRYDQATHSIMVRPQRLRLEQGRTTIWYIEGIPEDQFVTLHFDYVLNGQTGPFTSFSFSRGFGNSWIASGAGFLVGDLRPIPPEIKYFVTLRNMQGTPLHKDDPVIEPLESPPGG